MIFFRETEFQDSPIGIIPKEWEVTNLSDASLLVTDGSHFSPKHQSSGYPLATVANMRENNIDVDSCYRIAEGDYEKLVVTGDKPEVNDVLFSKDGTVGQCVVFRQKVDLVVLSSIAIIRPNLKKANPYFLKYMLQSHAALGRITGSKTGSAIKRIILRDLNSIKIALPKELEEQKCIVEVLTVVDSALELADRVIAKTERLKRGLMQRLLREGIGHKEFKDTPIGKIPKEWSVMKIGDVTSHVGSGLTPRGGSTTYLDEGIPLIRSQNVLFNKLDLSDVAYISLETHKFMRRSTIFPGDVLLNITGASIGRVTVVPDSIKEANVNQHVCRIRFLSQILPEFAAYYLSSADGQNQIMSFQSGATRQGLNYQQVRATQLPCPSLEEQKKIAEIMSTVDSNIDTERREKLTLERVKQGLMDLLLTGKIRVKAD